MTAMLQRLSKHHCKLWEIWWLFYTVSVYMSTCKLPLNDPSNYCVLSNNS